MLKARLLPFAIKATVVAIVFSMLGQFVAGFYVALLVNVSGPLLGSDVILVAERGGISVYQPGMVMIGTGGPLFYLGIILVTALIAATPGLKLRRRLGYIAIALLSIFVIHIISILVMAAIAPADEAGIMSSYTNPLRILFFVIGGGFFPVLIWWLLSYKRFIPAA